MKRLSETTKTTLALVALALAILGSWLIDPNPADPSPRAAAPTYATCFPMKQWDANPAERPCHSIPRVLEDGSAHLRLGTAKRVQAWCSIPNVSEQAPGQPFAIRCWRKAVR